MRELRDQAASMAPVQRERDPIRLWAAYLEFATPEAVVAKLEAHIRHWQDWLGLWTGMIGALERRDDPQLAERLAGLPRTRHDAVVAAKVYAYEGLVARADMEIAWARRGLDLRARRRVRLAVSSRPRRPSRRRARAWPSGRPR